MHIFIYTLLETHEAPMLYWRGFFGNVFIERICILVIADKLLNEVGKHQIRNEDIIMFTSSNIAIWICQGPQLSYASNDMAC